MVNLFELAVQWCAGFYWSNPMPNPLPNPMPRHFSSTGIFRPLEVVEVLQPANHQPRRQYLIAHAAGFTFNQTLKNTSDVTVLIADTIHQSPTHSPAQIIIKQYHCSSRFWCPDSQLHPSELEISTLTDPLVVRSLPAGLHVFPTLLSFQVYNATSPSTYRAALFYKYYNAGTLFDFIESHNRRREPIPEILIWHVIARLTRAYSFLHTGRPTYQPEVADPNWEPIVHSDGHALNVFLHNPSPEEMREDGSGVLADVCRDGLPQVVLGDFGEASSYGDDGMRRVESAIAEGAPEMATWLDKAQLGRVVIRMVGVKMLVGREAVLGVYSEELLSVVDVFQPLVGWLQVEQYWWDRKAAKTVSEEILAGFPTNEMVYGVLMGVADRKVEAYHAEKRRAEYEGLQEGVGASWVGFLGEKGL